MTIQKILLEFDPKPENLLPLLERVSEFFGFVSPEQATLIAEYFSLPESKVFETASFYDSIGVKPKAKVVVRVCSSTNCATRNSFRLISEIENLFKIKMGDENNSKICLEEVSCLGRCGEGPIMTVNGKVYEKVTKSSAYEILKEYV
jgi:NADH-quinone oxidoreductase subunit E